eukprot:14906197-Ditylum_brightwellii.AAC.1
MMLPPATIGLYPAWLVSLQEKKEARFKLKTVLGVSEEFYQHCQAFPIYSTGQGSTNSLTIWLFISSALFGIHEAKAHSATFTTPDKKTSVSLSM